jgi:hypothetical protein
MAAVQPWYRAGLALAAVVWLSACASGAGAGVAPEPARGGLVPYWPAVQAVPVHLNAGAGMPSLVIAPWQDSRPGANGRTVGDVQAAVFGVHGRELCSRDPTALVADAVKETLVARGLRVVAMPAEADVQLEGSLQVMSLKVAARDERRIAVHAVLRRLSDGQVLWSGLIEDRDDRFAGVMGNTRSELESYLGAGLAGVAARLGNALAPSLMAQGKSAGKSESKSESNIKSEDKAVPARPAEAIAAPPSGTGHVAVSTVPPRAKVYVDDVYHGLTPITLDLPSGVNRLIIKLDGYPDVTEKVAVRQGRTVELELTLRR